MNAIVLHTPLSSYQSFENNIFFQNELSLSILIVAVHLEFIQFFSKPFGSLYHEPNDLQKQILSKVFLGQTCMHKSSHLVLPIKDIKPSSEWKESLFHEKWNPDFAYQVWNKAFKTTEYRM